MGYNRLLQTFPEPPRQRLPGHLFKLRTAHKLATTFKEWTEEARREFSKLTDSTPDAPLKTWAQLLSDAETRSSIGNITWSREPVVADQNYRYFQHGEKEKKVGCVARRFIFKAEIIEDGPETATRDKLYNIPKNFVPLPFRDFTLDGIQDFGYYSHNHKLTSRDKFGLEICKLDDRPSPFFGWASYQDDQTIVVRISVSDVSTASAGIYLQITATIQNNFWKATPPPEGR